NNASQRQGTENAYQATGSRHRAAVSAAAPAMGRRTRAKAALAPIPIAGIARRSGNTSAVSTARYLELRSRLSEQCARSLLFPSIAQAEPRQAQHGADQQCRSGKQRRIGETRLLGDNTRIDDPQLLGAQAAGSGQFVR